MKPESANPPSVSDSSPKQGAKQGVDKASVSNDWDEAGDVQEHAPLTHDEAAKLFGEAALRPSRMTPLRVVALQLAITLVSAIVWYGVRGGIGGLSDGLADAAAISAIIGGACAFVPNALFALRLAATRGRPTVGALVVGESVKIIVTLAMLVAAALLYSQMDWPAMLVTFLLALKMLWIALVIR